MTRPARTVVSSRLWKGRLAGVEGGAAVSTSLGLDPVEEEVGRGEQLPEEVGLEWVRRQGGEEDGREGEGDGGSVVAGELEGVHASCRGVTRTRQESVFDGVESRRDQRDTGGVGAARVDDGISARTETLPHCGGA